jgi:hypothetical protein
MRRKKATLSPHLVLAFSVKGNLMLNPKAVYNGMPVAPHTRWNLDDTRELLFHNSYKL